MALEHVRAIMNRLSSESGFAVPPVTEIAERTRDPFQVLISCILSLRTRDETTGPASERLFELARTPETMRRLDPETIAKTIYPVGFYNTKAKTIIEICRLLIERHGGRVPDAMNDLLSLPGVGRKTANIVIVYGFGKPGLPIDTHCHRIPNRIGWVTTKTPDETERVLREELPRRYWNAFNDLFVQYGQNICKPIGPRCDICVIEKYCSKRDIKPRRPSKKGGKKRASP